MPTPLSEHLVWIGSDPPAAGLGALLSLSPRACSCKTVAHSIPQNAEPRKAIRGPAGMAKSLRIEPHLGGPRAVWWGRQHKTTASQNACKEFCNPGNGGTNFSGKVYKQVACLAPVHDLRRVIRAVGIWVSTGVQASGSPERGPSKRMSFHKETFMAPRENRLPKPETSMQSTS